MRTQLKRLAPLSAPLLLFAAAAFAAPPRYSVTLTDQQFQPARLTVPAGKKIQLSVKNAGSAVAEFESYDLNREKILPANSSVLLYIGPLDPGSYRIFNDFNQKVSGRIIAK